MSFIVAIDGPSGTGKGTVTEAISKKLGLECIDTGAMYRCVTLEMINRKIDLDEIEKIGKLLNELSIEFKKVDDKYYFILNGIDVTKDIRTSEVNSLVSQVSHIVAVRNAMVLLQREIAKNKNIIMEGRDIGTNVFPNADIKIYLDASTEERAKRRYKQNIEKGIQSSYEEILQNVIYRDNNDTSTNVGPLKIAEDAVVIDTTHLTIEETVNKIINIIEEKKSI